MTADAGARVYPVGRLDYDSEGLLIMTDDGEFAHMLMHPSHEIRKTYEARVQGGNILQALEILRAPMTIDGYAIRPAEVRLLDRERTKRCVVTIARGATDRSVKLCERRDLASSGSECIEGSLKLAAAEWIMAALERDEIENLQKCAEKATPAAKNSQIKCRIIDFIRRGIAAILNLLYH